MSGASVLAKFSKVVISGRYFFIYPGQGMVRVSLRDFLLSKHLRWALIDTPF